MTWVTAMAVWGGRGDGGCFSADLRGRRCLLRPSVVLEMPPGSAPVEPPETGLGGDVAVSPSPWLCGSGQAGGQVPPSLGGSLQGPGGSWKLGRGTGRVNLARGALTRAALGRAPALPNTPSPSQAPGGTWEVSLHPVPSRSTRGPRRVPSASPPLVSCSVGGSRSPNSLGGHQRRRLETIRGGGWWGEEWGGEGSVHQFVRPSIRRPEMVPPIPGAKQGGLEGSGLAHNALYSPSGRFRRSGSAGACGGETRQGEVRGVRVCRPPPLPAPFSFWGWSPAHLGVYVTSSAVSSGARWICW